MKTTIKKPKSGKGIKAYPIYNTNPFQEKVQLRIQETKTKQFRFGTKIQGTTTSILVDELTGDPNARIAFLKDKITDSDQYIKIFTDKLATFRDINKTGRRVFDYIMTKIQQDQDFIYFSIDDALDYTKYNSVKNIYDGLEDLLKKEIISRTKDHFRYYINPLIVYNGDRFSYIETYRKAKPKENPNQLEIDPNQLQIEA